MPHLKYLPELMGRASLDPGGPVVAGDFCALTLTYTAGLFGIDDTGILKVSWRNTSDLGKPQFEDPTAPNYVSVEASNGADLSLRCERINIRPFAQTLFIRVNRGFLREGDKVVVRFGDRSRGSPGLRMQTNVEKAFRFKIFVDPFAIYEFIEVPSELSFPVIAGPAECWKAILPTERRVGDEFRLALLAQDRWGNPAALGAERIALDASCPVAGLPPSVAVNPEATTAVIEHLSVRAAGNLTIDAHDDESRMHARSNPLRISERAQYLPYWGDLHGQSGETVGTNSAEDYFVFARDQAFIDITAHQANDFHIPDGFWKHLNELTARFNAPGRFVTLPGYEWSGNTGLGGDRNVLYASENEPIYRSHHALVDDRGDAALECPTAPDLFRHLSGHDAVVIAHVGGRYADLRTGHDGRIERAVEIHSTWGTFEWLLHDAFALGLRLGVVCHSDDHKGRQGATMPGASHFGVIGGLTCYLMPRLDRAAVLAALRARHHYGTTGNRLFLDVRATFGSGEVFDDDPALGPATSRNCGAAIMGDIVRVREREVSLHLDIVGSAPIERITVFNGAEPIATLRPFTAPDLSRRIRVIWEGAEYRGRGRETDWAGHAELRGNSIVAARAFNFFNPDRPLDLQSGTRAAWHSVTTGNIAGFDLWLADKEAGAIAITTKPAVLDLPIARIGAEDICIEAGGLGRRLRVFRLPDEGIPHAFKGTMPVTLNAGVDNPVYVRVTQEDGHQAWSSPIYFIA